MEIKRMLADGVELKIELTDEEMRDIYWKQLRIFRTNELLSYLSNWADDGGYSEELTDEKILKIIVKLNNDKDLLDRVAGRYEKYEMDYPDGEQEAECVVLALKYFELI